MEDKIKLSLVIPAISALISLLILLFGNNVYDRYFNNVNLVMETSKTNQFVPDEMVNVSKDFFSNQKIKNVADTLRIVRIENEGIPSKNLRIKINLDGTVYDYNIESNEAITNDKIEKDTTIVVDMERLSKNSEVILKIWLKDDSKSFSASYSDDISNKEILNKIENSPQKKLVFMTIVMVIFIESIIFFVISLLRRSKANRKDLDKREMIESVLAEISASLIDVDNQNESETEDILKSTAEKENIQQRLREFTKGKSKT